MRNVVVLAFYLSLVVLGSWAVYEWLVLGGRGIIFKAGGFLAVFGLYLIWLDFLSPDREPL